MTTTVNYTVKELLVNQDSKIELLHSKIDELLVKQAFTNGKVRLHTKWLIGITSALITFISLFVNHLIT